MLENCRHYRSAILCATHAAQSFIHIKKFKTFLTWVRGVKLYRAWMNKEVEVFVVATRSLKIGGAVGA
jgi:hypothetical protein